MNKVVNNTRTGLVALAVATASVPSLAQTIITSLSLMPDRIFSGQTMALVVEFAPGSTNWCGATIEWGDGEKRDIRIGDEGLTKSPAFVEHIFSGFGTTQIRVKGVLLRRGLKSAGACDVTAMPITVNVLQR